MKEDREKRGGEGGSRRMRSGRCGCNQKTGGGEG